MPEDLLTRIQRETHERLCELRAPVDEHNRLQAELRALETDPEPPVDLESLALPAAVLEPSRTSEPLKAPEPSAHVVRLPVRSRAPPRTRMVSPKVARADAPRSSSSASTSSWGAGRTPTPTFPGSRRRRP